MSERGIRRWTRPGLPGVMRARTHHDWAESINRTVVWIDDFHKIVEARRLSETRQAGATGARRFEAIAIPSARPAAAPIAAPTCCPRIKRPVA